MYTTILYISNFLSPILFKCPRVSLHNLYLEKDQTDYSIIREILEHFHKVMEYKVGGDRVYAKQRLELLLYSKHSSLIKILTKFP
jgi:hypothetical protein